MVAALVGECLSGNECAGRRVCVGGCIHPWVEVCLGTCESEGACVPEGVLSIRECDRVSECRSVGVFLRWGVCVCICGCECEYPLMDLSGHICV